MSWCKKIFGIFGLIVFFCCGILFNFTDVYAAKGDFFQIVVTKTTTVKTTAGKESTSSQKATITVTEKKDGSYKTSLKGDDINVSRSLGKKNLVVKIAKTTNCTAKNIKVGYGNDITNFQANAASTLSSIEHTCNPSHPTRNKTSTSKYTFMVTNLNEKAATTDEGGEDGDGDSKDKCADGGGALSLGWIICPVLSWAGDAAESLYNKFVEPALQIEPQLFTNSNGNTLAGWQTFQNIANIIFAILFLVVIFSQLTGVGIDNYGIKKTLPKLIVVAILINLSYFICVALVDVSNILGNSLQALFNGMVDGLNPSISDPEASFGEKGTGAAQEIVAIGGSIVGLAVAGFLVGMSGAIWGATSVALTLFISLIGVAISILMLFVLLAARQAAVVILVVISPLAVVCYALPNTKNLFKKWVDIFKALLILYPIAGLLVGGGNYVSALLLSPGMGDGILGAVIAMIAGIVPIFFIPSLTKSAFAGLGNLGAKISSFGDKMGKGAQNKVQNSRAYQGAKDKADAFKTSKQANGIRKLYNEDGTPKKGAFNGLRRAAMGGRSGALKTLGADYGNRRLMSESSFGAAMAGIEDKAKSEQVANVEAMLSNGRVEDERGNKINTADKQQLGAWHRKQMEEYDKAVKDKRPQAELNELAAKVKASQNILSQEKGGRKEVQSNLAHAISQGQYDAAGMSAASLDATHGEIYKNKNKGARALIGDAAKASTNPDDFKNIAKKIKNNTYATFGADDYKADVFGQADVGALENVRDYGGGINGAEQAKWQQLAADAIAMHDDPSNNYKIDGKSLAILNDIKNGRWGGTDQYTHVDQDGGIAGE